MRRSHLLDPSVEFGRGVNMGGSHLENIVLIIMVVIIVIVIITTQKNGKTIPTSDSHTVCISLRCRPIHVSILLQVNLMQKQ